MPDLPDGMRTRDMPHTNPFINHGEAVRWKFEKVNG